MGDKNSKPDTIAMIELETPEGMIKPYGVAENNI